METLTPDWFIESPVDAEHKQYLLLAYLQSVHGHFTNRELYPQLADLLSHYRNLVQFRASKSTLHNAFPERIKEINLEKLRLSFEKVAADDELMQTIEEILDFSIPQLKYSIEKAKTLYDGFESHISLKPVGIVPLYLEEGYLLLRVLPEPKSDIDVYRYRITLIKKENTRYRSLQTTYVTTYTYSLSNHYENIKKDLVNKHNDLPNPVTFALETDTPLPVAETLLPIAKRKLLTTINN